MPVSDIAFSMPRMGRLGTLRVVLIAMLWGLAGLRPANANAVTDWNNEFLLITQQTSVNLVTGPPEVAREMAIMGNAMSDAVNAATGDTIQSYYYTGGAVSGTNPSLVADAAAYTALTSIFTDAAWQTSSGTIATNTPTALQASTLANSIVLPEITSMLDTEFDVSSPSAICAVATSQSCISFNLGVSAANAVTTATAGDGAISAIQTGLKTNKPTGSGTTPGVYVPPAARPEMLPTWGSVTPMLATSTQVAAAQATVNGPPCYNGGPGCSGTGLAATIASPAYAAALLETECEGSSVAISALPANVASACEAAGYTQTNAQTNAALFWNDPGSTIQPPGHWLQIADTVMTSQNSSLLQSAQLTALLGDAEEDAGIAAWGVKYSDNLWRPTTAISSAALGCNNATGAVTWSVYFTTCDTSWSSLIATPPHPDYIAGHPAFSGAAATVLADFYDTDNISFSSSSNYYCNGGVAQFDPTTGLVVSCTAADGSVSYVSDASNGGQPDCASVVNGILVANPISGNALLICPITEDFSSFSQASSGANGAEFSRVVGGIHTPFSVEDALTVGIAVGQAVAADAGLSSDVPEPSALMICTTGLLLLIGLKYRSGARRPGFAPAPAMMPPAAVTTSSARYVTGAGGGSTGWEARVRASPPRFTTEFHATVTYHGHPFPL